MVELYWPRNTTFSLSTPSGVEKYRPGLHDIEEDRVERFKDRGWVDPSDDDVDIEIDRDEATVVVEDESDSGDQEEEVELDEDELSLASEGPDLEDDTDDHTESERAAAAEGDTDDADDEGDGNEFDAQSFVDRTPQREVIDDIESGEYDEYLDEIAAAEESARDRRGVERAVNERRDESEA